MLDFIEEHAQILPRPLVSYVYLRLKDSAKKKITFRIEKSSIPLWNEMKAPPTLQGLALTLKQVTKPDIPWGLILVGFSLLPHPEVEQPGLIQDIESALLGISILGIAIVARKIPHVTFFLFQMTWELVFFISIAINLISAGDDMSMQVIQAAFFVFFSCYLSASNDPTLQELQTVLVVDELSIYSNE